LGFQRFEGRAFHTITSTVDQKPDLPAATLLSA
jgi:hypothetical protein